MKLEQNGYRNQTRRAPEAKIRTIGSKQTLHTGKEESKLFQKGEPPSLKGSHSLTNNFQQILFFKDVLEPFLAFCFGFVRISSGMFLKRADLGQCATRLHRSMVSEAFALRFLMIFL